MPQALPAANRSIEISSSRLHCGRTANYGSLIIPGWIVALCRCHPHISAPVIACHTIG